MYLGKADVNTYEKGAGREFLVSNGRGSYGFSTVVGANTRREHGLLVTRSHGEPQHTVLVSKMEETLFTHNKKYQLSTNRYKDLVYPDGYRYLQEFQVTPIPSMLFVIHSIFLQKSIFMPQGGNCTIVKYKLVASPEKVSLEIRPLFAHRAKDYIPQPGTKPIFTSKTGEDNVSINGRGHDSHAFFSKGEWSEKSLWYENLIYEQDQNRDAVEFDQLWSPGYRTIEMEQGDVVYVVFSEDPVCYTTEQLEQLETETLDRLKSFVQEAEVPVRYSVIQEMIHASYHLIDDRPGAAPTIFSGYPSVAMKARETFISIPGLTLATGREKAAEGILDYWLNLSQKTDSIMPGLVDYSGSPVLEGADVGLWYLYAYEKYINHVGSDKKVKERWDALKTLLNQYIAGISAVKIHMDEDTRLLYLSGSNSLRHWMAGTAEGKSIVTRKGYLVEINALWYNALRFMERMANNLEDTQAAQQYGSIADACQVSFCKIFTNSSNKALFDWVDPKSDERDDAVRPNMILAVSLLSSPLPPETGRQVVGICWDELYTTYGLRTLAPRHEKFKGRAEGRPDQKAKARFRGMAWPWLLGHFISAYLRFNPGSKDMGWTFIRPFSSHLRHGCLGGVAEYFDGIMPYRPSGDVLSATSLGELLRILHEELLAETSRK